MPLKTKSSDYPRKSSNFSRDNSRGEDRPRRSFGDSDRPRREGGEDRPRRSFGDGERPRRSFGDSDRPRREGGEDRPRRSFGDGDRPRRSFGDSDRPLREGGEDRPRRSFGDGDRPRRSFGDSDRPRREGGDDRPRRSFGDGDRPRRSFGDSDRPRRSFGDGDRPRRSFGDSDRPRRSFGDGDRPRRSFDDDRAPRRDEAYHDAPKRDEAHQERRDARPAKSKDGIIYLYGWHVVRAVLRNPLRQKIAIYCTEIAQEKLQEEPDFSSFSSLIEIKPIEDLTKMVGYNAVHQGVIVATRALADETLEKFLENHPENFKIVALDQVQDPHNIGAIMRSSAFMGVDAVLVVDFGTPMESAIIAKSASGALEMVPLIRVKNLRQALESCKAAGAWVYGFMDEEPAKDLSSVKFDKKSIMLFGAEGKGLRQLSQTHTDYLVRIAAKGDSLKLAQFGLDSLNVSNAVALALYHAQHEGNESI